MAKMTVIIGGKFISHTINIGRQEFLIESGAFRKQSYSEVQFVFHNYTIKCEKQQEGRYRVQLITGEIVISDLLVTSTVQGHTPTIWYAVKRGLESAIVDKYAEENKRSK